ncbi:cytochrome c [Erythrobacter sp.]|uniref:c-type cytochrome n=1 Tax=Erythrobacter sp. TaxID=1042 RepID=UPI001425DCB7|nr:cytochrome c [Erythrobacter sp.]QIQ87442.1 MAG: cytochrome c [Erythrobacter sp.]
MRQISILSAALLAAGCATDRNTVTLPEDAAKGRAFAQANCAGCHAMDDGVSPNADAPSLRRVARRLPEWVVEGSLERGVKLGHTSEMPVFVFEEGDVENLSAYLAVLRARD